MGKYANFYDGVRKLLDKIADALDPGTADVKTANYQTAVLNSLSRIGDKVGDVVSATLPDASTATDGDTLVVDDGEWVIGSGGGGGTGGGAMVATATQSGAYVPLDKTWKELADAMESGIVPVILYNDGTNKYKETVTMINETSDLYSVSTTSFTFEVDTETGYPSYYAD